MSCHDIGRGMNSVVNVVVNLYDHGEITRPSAAAIIHAARKGVYWCDGNEYEAIESIDMNRCGYCLHKMESGEPLYPVFESFWKWPYPVEEDFAESLATYRLCTECYDKLVAKSAGDPAAGPKARQGIEAECDEDEWRAE